MKIRIDKDIVTFTPENAAETAELEALWIKMGNCVGDSKSLQPIGVYMPSQDKTAVFHIEGLNQQERTLSPRSALLMIQMCIVSPATRPFPSKPAKPFPPAAAD